jgi:hypothetical protein
MSRVGSQKTRAVRDSAAAAIAFPLIILAGFARRSSREPKDDGIVVGLGTTLAIGGVTPALDLRVIRREKGSSNVAANDWKES